MKISKKIGLLLAGTAIASTAIAAPIIASATSQSTSVQTQVQASSSRAITRTVRIVPQNLERSLSRIETTDKLENFLSNPYNWVRTSGVTNHPDNISSVSVNPTNNNGRLSLDVRVEFVDGTNTSAKVNTSIYAITLNENAFRNNFFNNANNSTISDLPALLSKTIGGPRDAYSTSSKLIVSGYSNSDMIVPYNVYNLDIKLNDGYCFVIGNNVQTNSLSLSNLQSNIKYDINFDFDGLKNYLDKNIKNADIWTINDFCSNSLSVYNLIKSNGWMENTDWLVSAKATTYTKWLSYNDLHDLGAADYKLQPGNYLFVRVTIELTNGNKYNIDQFTPNRVYVTGVGPGYEIIG